MAELRHTDRRRTEVRRPVSSTGQSRKRRKTKKRKNTFRGLFFLAVFLCVLAAAVIGWKRFAPGRAWADYKELYGVGAEGTVILCNGEQAEGILTMCEGRPYLSYDAASGADCKWYYGSDGLLLYSLANETVTIAPSSHTYTKGGQTVDLGYALFYVENGTAYISVDFMSAFTGMKAQMLPADTEKNLPARLLLEADDGSYEQAEAAKKTQVRVLAGIKSPILTETKKGESLRIIDSVDDWTRVRTEDGFTGYIKTKYLKNRKVQENTASVLPPYTSVRLPEKVSMAWHQVFSPEDNGELDLYLEGTQGINVLSPTWFSVADNSGNLNSLADASYVAKAHGRGIQVWALIDDFDSNVDVLALLSSSEARGHIIDQLMTAVSQYSLDGINVDFEGIKEDSAPHFLQFIRELSIACRQAGKVLSIDNYVPSGGRAWYNLKEQGQVADYVVIMGYDEHYKGCCSGTNASLDFSEQGIVRTLKEVPAEKVINGLPFFMRLWQETPEAAAPEGATLYEDGLSVYEGRYTRDSRAIGMPEAKQILEERGLTPEWDDVLGQYYVQYEENGSTFRIWLEEEESIRLKMEKVKEHGIAGAAFWKLGLESPEVWPVITEALSE